MLVEIRVSSLGLSDLKVKAYVAHEKGNWNLPGNDYKENPFEPDVEKSLKAVVDLLPGEQFKIVVTGLTRDEAREVFKLRQRAGVLVGNRFDYDASEKTFWLLAPAFPVVNWGEWNQNNFTPRI